MIVGGKNRKRSYSEKEYILAALNLYMDGIQLFFQIMQLLDALSHDKNEKR
jgi:FtsH-binding integral membrane protein